MAELKTKPTDQSVNRFVKGIPDEGRRQECRTLLSMMEDITGSPARMWGSSIVGFGSYHYAYASGRQGDWFLTGFSPRKQNLTVYVLMGFEAKPALMKTLGKYSTGKSCLYIKSLEDVHVPTLKKLVRESVRELKRMNR
jgi:hypothetical protein